MLSRAKRILYTSILDMFSLLVVIGMICHQYSNACIVTSRYLKGFYAFPSVVTHYQLMLTKGESCTYSRM